MTYRDHVLTFSDRAAALAALEPLGLAAGDEFGPSCIPDGTLRVGDTALPGYHIGVCEHEVRADLIALAGNACRCVRDRESGDYLYVAPDIDPAALAAAIFEPVPAGSAYI